MEIFLFARLLARPGMSEHVRAAILEVLEPTRREEGCLGIHMFHSVRDGQEYYIHSHWRDLAAFEHHAELSHTVRFSATVEPLLQHPLKVTLTERID